MLQKTHLPGRPELSFNLEITGPISHYLNEESAWQGVSGDYTITLGENCSAASGCRPGLPLLKASVGGFSRLWLDCASATAISLSGEIEADQNYWTLSSAAYVYPAKNRLEVLGTDRLLPEKSIE